MATYLLRVNWKWNEAFITGGDRIVWGYHVDAPAVPSALDFETDFVGALTSGALPLSAAIPAEMQLDTLQVYDVVNGGPPVDEIIPVDPTITTGAGVGPTEVQLVVSRRVNDGLGRPFKKGRTYIGPFSPSFINAARPDSTLMGRCANFSVTLHANFVARGWTPVVDTKGALHVPEEIVDYVIDNAWDTQRRRGLDPTAETVYPLS